jgi:hypothetical protein
LQLQLVAYLPQQRVVFQLVQVLLGQHFQLQVLLGQHFQLQALLGQPV